MPGRPYILAEAALSQTADVDWNVAVLPWGATEPHNFHLPYGTDSYQAANVAAESARRAWEAGARVSVLPVVPFGVNTQQMGTTLAINMNPSTQAMVLEDVVASLEHHNVQKLVVLNGHGGNHFRQMIRELQARTDVFLCAIDWYKVVPYDGFFDEAGDHAGELETCMMQHLEPGLVHDLSIAGPGDARTFCLEAMKEGWAWAPRDWKRVTDDTGVGNPAAATPEKGARYMNAVCAEIGTFLTELAATHPDDMYGTR